ncbi:DUF2007 domain-containing protein [Hydrotalea sp.]|uniref:putative signal transducing protein n=1 Tax=Hydrotalea sp. TaxID=2881279 RepID=UPI002585F6D0|nr:DUF2007 domain-containing protein [Hydrotalea sp.]
MKDKPSWYLLFSTQNFPKASIIKGVLEENCIPVQVLNKLDSSYLIFGQIEIYVPMHLKDVAQHLLQRSLLN